ncbi:hypothetical protein HMPREF3167_07980 [Trueperella sp. HMSC08B05]|nr:hypothetical protein AKG36_02350 [Trueperella bernardiae]OFS66123.1 hypothetical protein HMPREF3174_05860 [Trueperella sp. HMSC08H06]OFS72417.1 hypothetical protein HMPREF3167_07980 [Trueperella sp. HMSC08B05]PKZ89215.1 hypothetical protein CYK24_02605 [Trueperella bernardiae]
MSQFFHGPRWRAADFTKWVGAVLGRATVCGPGSARAAVATRPEGLEAETGMGRLASEAMDG